MCIIDFNSILFFMVDIGGVWFYLGFDVNSSLGVYIDNFGIMVFDLIII